jgi:hypothetical protein
MIHRSENLNAETGVVTIEEVDTTAQTVTTTVGANDPEVRPMTAEEIAMYVEVDANYLHEANTAEMVASSDPAVDKLIATINKLNTITAMTNASINANVAPILKDLARECKTIARQLNHEARLTSGRTEDTDTGPLLDV